jgi:hypothetical protein
MRTILVVTTVGLLLGACSNDLSERDAQVAWAATYVALADGQTQAQLAASGTPAAAGEETSFRGLSPRAGANVNYSGPCTGGGSASYVGSAEAVTDGAGAGAVTFDLAATFDACSVAGITISGDLDYSAAVVADTTSAMTELKMIGSLSYDGEVEGSCDWDLRMKFAANTSGMASAEFSGSICGHDASGALTVG